MSRRPLLALNAGLVVGGVTLLGCASRTTAPATAVDGAALVDAAAVPPPAPPPPPPPPPQGIQAEGIRFDWTVQGSELRFTLSAPTTGWVRVGFNTVAAQHQANMIVGWVQDGQAMAQDRFAVDPPYIEPDTQHGGADSVTVLGGQEADGRTQVQLQIPLDTGEATDLGLRQGGSYYLILSYGADDDPDSASVVQTAVPITL